MSVVQALFLTVGVLALLAAGLTATRGSAHRDADTARRGLAGFLVALGVAFLAFSAPDLVDQLYPNLVRWLSNTATLTAAFAALRLLVLLTTPDAERAARRIRARFAALLVALAVMTALFFTHPVAEASGSFGNYAVDALAVYVLIYSAYLGVALIDMVVLVGRFGRAARPVVRTGLVLVALGCVVGLVYLAGKVVYVSQQLVIEPAEQASSECASPVSSLGCAINVATPMLSVLLILLGATLPALARLLRWPGEQCSHARLYPLWQALSDELPEIRFVAPHAVTGRYGRGQLGMRLYRRLIEIHDGVLALNSYRDPMVAASATAAAHRAGLSGTELAATVEAAEIAAALHAHRTGVTFPDAPGPPDPAGPEHQIDDTGERRWLEAVATAFAHSPITADYRARPRPNTRAGGTG